MIGFYGQNVDSEMVGEGIVEEFAAVDDGNGHIRIILLKHCW